MTQPTLNLNPPERPRWKTFEAWQLNQLVRLARFDAERMELLLNVLWESYPSLYEELAIAAVEHGELSTEEAGRHLHLTAEEIDYRVELTRDATWTLGQSQIIESPRGALVEDSQVYVWEIVREYRKLGSIDRLVDAFPGLTTGQLASAIAYARERSEEIEAAIAAYEDMLQRKRDEYPFA